MKSTTVLHPIFDFRRKSKEILYVSVPDLESKHVSMMLDFFYKGSVSFTGIDNSKALRELWNVFQIDSVRLDSDSVDVIPDVVLHNSKCKDSNLSTNTHADILANIKQEINEEVMKEIDLKRNLEVECSDCKETFYEEEDLLRHMEHIHGTTRSMYNIIKYKRAKENDKGSSHPKIKKGKGKVKKLIEWKPLRRENENNSNDEAKENDKGSSHPKSKKGKGKGKKSIEWKPLFIPRWSDSAETGLYGFVITNGEESTNHERSVATDLSASNSNSESSSGSTINHASDTEVDVAVVDITNSPSSVDVADSPPRVVMQDQTSHRSKKPTSYRKVVLPARKTITRISMKKVSPDDSIMEMTETATINNTQRSRECFRHKSPGNSTMEIESMQLPPSPSPSIMEIDDSHEEDEILSLIDDPDLFF